MDNQTLLAAVDHTLLTQTATWDEIRQICDDGAAYGCASVYENTLAAVRAAGLRFRPAPPCRDVDVPEDLRRLRGTVRPGSHTARLLNTLQWEENDP